MVGTRNGDCAAGCNGLRLTALCSVEAKDLGMKSTPDATVRMPNSVRKVAMCLCRGRCRYATTIEDLIDPFFVSLDPKQVITRELPQSNFSKAH